MILYSDAWILRLSNSCKLQFMWLHLRAIFSASSGSWTTEEIRADG